MRHSLTTHQKIFFITLLTLISHSAQANRAVDYNGNLLNGNLLNRSGTIIITPQTSSQIVANYTQSISLAGLPDNTFGQLGIVISQTAKTQFGQAALLQPDGRIVVVGSSNTGFFCLARYNSNGSVDATFNGGNPAVGATTTATAFAALLQPDGKIVAVGSSQTGHFCLIRYNPNGSVDTSFNGGTPAIGAAAGSASTTLLQPDGKIVAVGWDGTPHFCITRYNSNGSVDSSFNGGNPVTGAGSTFQANAGLLQPDGKIIAVGESQGGGNFFCLTRYNPNGAVDNTFNGGNPVIGAATTGRATAALLQPDGKIVALGSSQGGHFCLARYNSDGTPDTTFGTLGVATGAATTNVINAALLQPDGKIVAIGQSLAGHFCVARYNSDGSVDPTFNNGTPVFGPDATGSANAALLQLDNKIIAVGSYNGPDVFCLIRYTNPFTLTSFTTSYGTVGLL